MITYAFREPGTARFSFVSITEGYKKPLVIAAPQLKRMGWNGEMDLLFIAENDDEGSVRFRAPTEAEAAL